MSCNGKFIGRKYNKLQINKLVSIVVNVLKQ